MGHSNAPGRRGGNKGHPAAAGKITRRPCRSRAASAYFCHAPRASASLSNKSVKSPRPVRGSPAREHVPMILRAGWFSVDVEPTGLNLPKKDGFQVLE